MQATSGTLTQETIVTLAWIGFATAGIAAIPFTIIGTIAFWKTKDAAGTFTKFFERAQVLKLTTVVLIILSVTTLTLFRIIESNGAVGILSGIAGYVLGSLEKRRDDASIENNQAGGNTNASQGDGAT